MCPTCRTDLIPLFFPDRSSSFITRLVYLFNTNPTKGVDKIEFVHFGLRELSSPWS